MSGHHNLSKLVEEIEAATATLFAGHIETESEAAQALLSSVRTAFTSYCPNVQLASDEQVDALAKAFYTKVLKERKAHPKNHDMRVLPWEEEADNIRESWQYSIRIVLATGELPREGIA